jgi:NAD(P)-dependent dehydrogenase (short-subunit alcohol dehydrogenase family)
MAQRSSVKPRVALVTGANRGIGLEVSKQLLAKGLPVVMTARDPDAAEHARRTLGDLAERALVVRMDVRDTKTIEAAFDTARSKLGQVDVLVNNAAILLDEHEDVLSISAESFRKTLDTNLLGVIETCRVFVPPMSDRRYGRVVNVSSTAGQLSTMATYAPAYSISKSALNALTRILAATHGKRGVLVNSVCPGWVRTDMGGAGASRSVEKGAETIVWLATLPDGGPSGGFFRDRKPIDW